MKKCKKILILTVLLFLYILISTINYVNATTSNISSEVFRLHVIANSDSEKDQALKYKVRDAILEYVEMLSKSVESKQEVIEIVSNNLSPIEKIAENVIKEEGFDYDVTARVGNFSFPTKNYGDISLPSGFYDALKVEIGNASGKNWWCVMFPPLCFVDITTGIVPDESKEVLEENLDTEEYAIISEDTGIMKFKFKLIEMFENINIALGNNDK